MSNNRCILFVLHDVARLFDVDRADEGPRQIRLHAHNTAQHGSAVRDEHEFHAAVCEALAGCGTVLVVGSHGTLAGLRHYIVKHSPPTKTKISAIEVVDHPTDHQLIAMGRAHFDKVARGDALPAAF